MAVKRKMSGAGVSVPVGIVIGIAVSVAAALLGALLIAYLVLCETMPMDGAGLGAHCAVLVSSALGCLIASALTKKQRILVSALTALGFFLVLLSVTAICFDGVFAGVGLSALMILLGAGGSLLPGLRKKTGKSRIKIPRYR